MFTLTELVIVPSVLDEADPPAPSPGYIRRTVIISTTIAAIVKPSVSNEVTPLTVDSGVVLSH